MKDAEFERMEQPSVHVDPIGEILSKKLFGFESCTYNEQKRMINRAIKEAMEYHHNTLRQAHSEGFNEGRETAIDNCANMVSQHWNDSQTMVNQREQAYCSAGCIRSLKKDR